MAAGDTYQRISPSEKLIYNAAGQLVGIQSGHASGGDLYFDPNNISLASGSIDGNPVALTQKLRKWRAAVARARTGGSIAKLALVGDSTTRGMGSNGSLFGNNLVSKSYPAVLATLLTKSLAQAQANSFFGTTGGGFTTDDTRVSMTGGWGASGITSLGGPVLTSSATGVLTFTPTANCKTWDIYYLASSGLGTFNIDVGGVGTTLINANATGGTFQKATIVAGSSSLAALNITWQSAGCYILGVDGRDPADLVSVWNMGWSGSKAADWTSASSPTWSPPVALPQLAPDLTVIDLTINDWIAGTNAATYSASVQQMITAGLSTGDVILMTGVPSSTASATAANQATILAAFSALATSNAVPLIDLTYRWGDFTTSNALGMYFDTLHPTARGYADVAGAVQRVIGYL